MQPATYSEQENHTESNVVTIPRAEYDSLKAENERLRNTYDTNLPADETLTLEQVAEMGLEFKDFDDLIEFSRPRFNSDGKLVFIKKDVDRFIEICGEELSRHYGNRYPLFDINVKNFLEEFAAQVDGEPAKIASMLACICDVWSNCLSCRLSTTTSDYKLLLRLLDKNKEFEHEGWIIATIHISAIRELVSRFITRIVLKNFLPLAEKLDLRGCFLNERQAFEVSTLGRTGFFKKAIRPIFFDPVTAENYYEPGEILIYDTRI